jgi:hypothetical protein
VADDHAVEPFFNRKGDSCNYRNTEPPCIVCLPLINPSACLPGLYSVSSVQTLEEAKVSRGCLYMAMPVQEVSEIAYQGGALLIL